MNEEVRRFLLEKGYKLSPKKDYIWFKIQGMVTQYLDLNQMACYAYGRSGARQSSEETNRDLQQIKIILDKDQIKLF